MAAASEHDGPFEAVGSREDPDRLLTEYHLDEQELGDRIEVRQPPRRLPDETPAREYLVHGSILRPHGDFACAGDSEALAFCENIVTLMVAGYGISRGEAVARINRHWSQVWIVGSDVVYHEDAQFWAASIYHGPDSRWWDPAVDLPAQALSDDRDDGR